MNADTKLRWLNNALKVCMMAFVAITILFVLWTAWQIGYEDGKATERRAYLNETNECTAGLKGFAFCTETKCVMKTHKFRDNEVWRCNGYKGWEPVPQ